MLKSMLRTSGNGRNGPGKRTPGPRNPQAAASAPTCPGRRRPPGRARGGAGIAAPSRCRSADPAFDLSPVMVLTSVCRLPYWLSFAATADCAACSALAGAAAPLSAFCTAVHICWEMTGYLVPRLSPVRALATPTAVTHELSEESAVNCACCPALVGAM